MKSVFYCIMLAVVFSACKKKPKPADPTPVGTKVNIRGFLGTCSDVSEGLKNLKIRVSVDYYNSSGTVTANFKNYLFNNKKNNETDASNYEFPIDVPTSGTYGVSVTVEANDCFRCCQGSCTTYTPAWGYPFWRGLSTLYNTQPPPAIIYVTPAFVSCD
jgi:hypothetical protein